MVRTKHTQHGSSLQRPTGMQVAVYSDCLKADQFDDKDERNWPDFDNLVGTAAQQSAQASKSTGETGEGSKAVEILPTDNPLIQLTPRTPLQIHHLHLNNHWPPLKIHQNPRPVPVQLTPRTPPKILKRKKIQP